MWALNWIMWNLYLLNWQQKKAHKQIDRWWKERWIEAGEPRFEQTIYTNAVDALFAFRSYKQNQFLLLLWLLPLLLLPLPLLHGIPLQFLFWAQVRFEVFHRILWTNRISKFTNNWVRLLERRWYGVAKEKVNQRDWSISYATVQYYSRLIAVILILYPICLTNEKKTEYTNAIGFYFFFIWEVIALIKWWLLV